jgi:predicted nucleic acid-binding protein
VILIDTSIWIDHLRARDEKLVKLLTGGNVLSHPFVIGETRSGGSAIWLASSKNCSDYPSRASPRIKRCFV